MWWKKKSTEYVLLKWPYFYNSNLEFVLYSGWDIFVFSISVSTVISSGRSGHICSSCPGCSFGWRQDLSHFFKLLFSCFCFFFWQKLCNCQITSGRLQPLATLLCLGMQTQKMDLFPQDISPGVVVPIIDFAWPHIRFDHIPANSVFQTTLWWAWQRHIQMWRQLAETQQLYSAARISHGFNTGEKCPLIQYILNDNYFQFGT